MKLHIYKYHGAGNDFVIIDNRSGNINLTDDDVRFLCHRRFGVGADGLMLLGSGEGCDFTMRYFNSDGPEGTMCGNGGRCIVAFASLMGIKKFEFQAIDGYHRAEILSQEGNRSLVRLKMRDLDSVTKFPEGYCLDTGSDHFVLFVDNVADMDVFHEGCKWRHDSLFPAGTNVNFVQDLGNELFVRTFERGVEDETLACGTGVTASSISAYLAGSKSYTREMVNGKEHIKFNIKALGDNLSVDFVHIGKESFRDVYLTGPATLVFEADIEI